jgi:hypothetical protein
MTTNSVSSAPASGPGEVGFLPQLRLPLLQFGIGTLVSLLATDCARNDANDKI